jgi:negative regulator of sigma E activity
MISQDKISSACDGDALTSRLIKQIASDKQAQETWETNHLIGSLIRNEMPGNFRPGFMDRFNEEFADAPIHFPRKEETRKVGRFSGVIRYLGQAAIAASVAAFTLVGLNYVSINGGASVDQVLNTTPYGGTASPVKANIRASSNSLHVVPRGEYQTPSRSLPDYPAERAEQQVTGGLTNNELAQIEALLRDHVYQMQRTQN